MGERRHLRGIIAEYDRSLRQFIREDARECIYCYCPIDDLLQQRYDGACPPCRDAHEYSYWTETERLFLAAGIVVGAVVLPSSAECTPYPSSPAV